MKNEKIKLGNKCNNKTFKPKDSILSRQKCKIKNIYKPKHLHSTKTLRVLRNQDRMHGM